MLFDTKAVRFVSQPDRNLIETESIMLRSDNIYMPDLSHTREGRRLTVMVLFMCSHHIPRGTGISPELARHSPLVLLPDVCGNVSTYKEDLVKVGNTNMFQAFTALRRVSKGLLKSSCNLGLPVFQLSKHYSLCYSSSREHCGVMLFGRFNDELKKNLVYNNNEIGLVDTF